MLRLLFVSWHTKGKYDLLAHAKFYCLKQFRSRTKVKIANHSSVTSTDEAVAIADDKELDQAMPVYAEPINIKQDVCQ